MYARKSRLSSRKQNRLAVSGIPVGIISTPDGLSHNPIPDGAANGRFFLLDPDSSFDSLLKLSEEAMNNFSPPKNPDDILE